MNNKELISAYTSEFKNTDPELVEIFENFVNHEVFCHGVADTRLKFLVLLTVMITSQSINGYCIMLENALNAGISPVEIKETVYQAVPYAGMARVFDFIRITNEVFKNRGINLPQPEQSFVTEETRMEKGLAVQKSIFGEQIDRMYEESPKDTLYIQKFLSGNCFGDFYTRGGIDVKTREVLTFSILLVLGGCEPQLKGHIQGNLHAGNDRGLLLSVITECLPYVGYPRTLNAIRCVDEITGL